MVYLWSPGIEQNTGVAEYMGVHGRGHTEQTVVILTSKIDIRRRDKNLL